MRVFVTGATGWVGSAVVKDLIAAGHQVLGLARSDAGARPSPRPAPRSIAARSRIWRASARRRAVGRRDPHRLQPRLLEVRRELRRGSARHRGDRRRARRLRPSAARHLRPGAARARQGRDRTDAAPSGFRHLSAQLRKPPPRRWRSAACARRRSGCRLGPWPRRSGLRSARDRDRAREGRLAPISATGSTAGRPCIGSTPPRVYRLALERGAAGGPFHAVAEEGVPFKEIAEVIGRRLKFPVVSQSPGGGGRAFRLVRHVRRHRRARPRASAPARCSAGSRNSPGCSPISIIPPISSRKRISAHACIRHRRDGWIGSAVVKDLLASGHKVTGLTTTAEGARKLQALGAEARVGRLSDHALLRESAAELDGVIHLAFIHGLSNMSLPTRLRLFAGVLNGGIVQSFLSILAETELGRYPELWARVSKTLKRPLVVASGLLGLPQGKVSTERDNHVPERSKQVFLRDGGSGPDCARRPFFDRAACRRPCMAQANMVSYPASSQQRARKAFRPISATAQSMAGGACDRRRRASFVSRLKKAKRAQSSTALTTKASFPRDCIADLGQAERPDCRHSSGEGRQAFRHDRQFRRSRQSGVQRMDRMRWVGGLRVPACLPTWTLIISASVGLAAAA